MAPERVGEKCYYNTMSNVVRVDISAGTNRRLFNMTEHDDGSLYISIVRTRPEFSERHCWNPTSQAFEGSADNSRDRRISYHTSGRVNYHGLIDGESLYFEPLVGLTAAHVFFEMSIPGLDRLDPVSAADARDVERCEIRLDISSDERFTIQLAVAPLDWPTPANAALRIGYPTAALLICINSSMSSALGMEKHFIYARPSVGAFEVQPFPRLEAELAYHQLQHGRQILIYPPNDEGVYTLYPSAVMRVTPRIEVDFIDPNYEILPLVEGSRPNRIRFKIRGTTGYVKKWDLRELIAEVRLEAEL